MYLLTEWEGGKGKYMARGPCVLTDSQISSHLTRPNSVNEHFIIWLLCFWVFLTERKRFHGSICLVSLSLCAYGPLTGLFYHMVFQRNSTRNHKGRIINYFLERNFTKVLTKRTWPIGLNSQKSSKKFLFSGKIGTFQQWHLLDDDRISDLPY